MPDYHRGLYNKFTVIRNDGSSAEGGKHHKCNYFVLDLTHDRYAAVALKEYADACKEDFPFLAADLYRMLGELSFSILPRGTSKCLVCGTPLIWVIPNEPTEDNLFQDAHCSICSRTFKVLL